MKKYKLIKTYPGSPKLSTEIIETKINSLCPVDECYISRKTFMLIGYDSFEIENPKNYPEFWEEVIEKDYEILSVSLRRSEKDIIRKLDLQDSDEYINSLIKCDGNGIHSVKRLSDGKVFNIGDNATTDLNNYGPITAFEIDCNRMYIRTNGSSKGTFSCNIKNLIVSELLFKTEDGVNIFEGDKAYECARNGKCYNKSHKFTPLNSRKHSYNSIGKDWIVFSTEEKAEEYILLNTPCICLKDLIEAFFPKDYNFNNRKSEGAI